MNNFEFFNPVKIILGNDTIKKIEKEIPLSEKIMLLYGSGSIKKNGVYEEIKKALAKHKIIEFDGILPNPSYEQLLKARDRARENNVSFLLAVGGGSVIDASKFISVAIPYAGDPWDFMSSKERPQSSIPIGVVLTLPATGSEMNSVAVISKYQTKEKRSLYSPYIFPKFSILDPISLKSLSKDQMACGIADIFMHVMEQYMVQSTSTPLQEKMAEAILETLIHFGPKYLNDPSDSEIGKTIMWCASQAFNGLIGAGIIQDWSTHRIGHELTALFEIPHGKTLTIIYPSLLKYLFSQKKLRLAQYAKNVLKLEGKNQEELATNAVVKIKDFFITLNLPTSLAEVNLNKTAIDEVITSIKRHGILPLGEKKNIFEKEIKEILMLASAN